MFEVLCGWCKKITGRSDVSGSTGMCAKCLKDRYGVE